VPGLTIGGTAPPPGEAAPGVVVPGGIAPTAACGMHKHRYSSTLRMLTHTALHLDYLQLQNMYVLYSSTTSPYLDVSQPELPAGCQRLWQRCYKQTSTRWLPPPPPHCFHQPNALCLYTPGGVTPGVVVTPGVTPTAHGSRQTTPQWSGLQVVVSRAAGGVCQ